MRFYESIQIEPEFSALLRRSLRTANPGAEEKEERERRIAIYADRHDRGLPIFGGDKRKAARS